MIEEEKDFEIPEELKREILDIMNDSPTLEWLGGKQYRVHRLRMYSLNRILSITFDLIKREEVIADSDKQLIFLICTDLNIASEIIAIILCNHLFTPDKIKMDNIDDIYSYNDKLIRYMKAKVQMSDFDDRDWASIILGAITSIDLSKVFQTLVLVKQSMVSLTNPRKKAEEQLQSWQEAQSAI